MKVRCIDTKTGRIFHTSKAVAENAAFMHKYGYKVQDLQASTIPAALPATEPEEQPITTDIISDTAPTPTTPITKVSAPPKPKNKGGRPKRKPSK